MERRSVRNDVGFEGQVSPGQHHRHPVVPDHPRGDDHVPFLHRLGREVPVAGDQADTCGRGQAKHPNKTHPRHIEQRAPNERDQHGLAEIRLYHE